MDSLDMTSPANASPPDFDFNLPCRFFKSSFARSLSLTNANSSGNNNGQCKSLDYDNLRFKNNSSGSSNSTVNNNNNNNKMVIANNSNNNNITNTTATSLKRDIVPPIPQKRSTLDGCQNEAANNKPVALEALQANELNDKSVAAFGNEKPPALPARRPISGNNAYSNNIVQQKLQLQQQQQQQTTLTQLRQQALNKALSEPDTPILPVNTNPQQQHQHQQHLQQQQQQQQQQHQFNQKLINQYPASSNGHNNSNNSSNISSNFRRNRKVWPNKQNVEQEHNNHNYEHQQQHHQQQQQHHHHQQQHDNTTNVEAVILQNQVDSLQWQLKQVETSRDMYRAVMEEVARFLERYQNQWQQQQQLQQQLQQQQQQQTTAQKTNNYNGKMDQMSRSKSLYQVYTTAGDNEKSTTCNNLGEESKSASYLRARSSTNLIDLKQNPTNNRKMTNAKGHSKDDHNYETDGGLTPAQSYSAFKDYTWRRSPHNAHDDIDEKLNQEAFRLRRTIHNLLNTSQHQPDLGHYNHNHPPPSQLHHNLYHSDSLPATSALNMGRISKATLPGAPLHNSTNLTDSSTTLPTIAAVTPNTLAPEMLFLRTANMRDSRLSLRSSTDSSVHSSSSAASTVSSKVETDEEPTTPFQPPPKNILAHKQQHHSSTEDESGFGSISSFPDIGVPLSSTLLPSLSNGDTVLWV